MRGNHEDCERAGLGWLKLLGPLAFDPAAPCMAHLAPYSIPLAAMNLVVIDDVTALEKDVVTDMVPVFRSEIRALDQQPSPSWLLLHRPIWAAISGPLGIPIGGSQTMIAAATNGIPSPVTLMLAGVDSLVNSAGVVTEKIRKDGLPASEGAALGLSDLVRRKTQDCP